jgi:oxalate decarboxylase/phosphoglucose isomerase-like protein (cupin superfamily)
MIPTRITRLPRRLVADARGTFIKCIDGHEPELPGFTGEVYMVRAFGGQRRGDHYHPLAREWFTVIAGEGVLALQDIASGERLDLQLSAARPETVFIPPGLAHVFVNDPAAREDLIVVAYTDRLYDPADTIPHVVR